MPRWIAQLFRRRRVSMVQGSRPGFLWENYPGRWVPIERALSCRCDAYSEFGPVHTDDGLPV
jgi:hypothetical protein